MSDVTRILDAVRDGVPRASDELLAAVYVELRRLAGAQLAREKPGNTLQPTALVHEVYLRLLGGDEVNNRWENRRHFFAAASEAMRRILIERARRKARRARSGGSAGSGGSGGSGGEAVVDVRDCLAAPADADGLADRLLLLNAVLEKFANEDPAKAELVKLRFFGGLQLAQTAEVLGISRATASRHWAYAKAWLYAEMAAVEGK